MLLSFNIANHFRSNPLVYLNDLRINGDKHNPLSYSQNNQLIFTIDVEDDVLKTLPNHYLALLLRKSENGDFISISLLKSKDYFDFYEEVFTQYFDFSSEKGFNNVFIKNLLEKQSSLICFLGSFSKSDLSFFKENQANLNDIDVYLKNINCNNDDTYVLYESHFNYLKEQGNELLTKTHGSTLSRENLILKQNLIEKIICQIVYVKKYDLLNSPLFTDVSILMNFNQEFFDNLQDEQQKHQYFIEKLFQSVSPMMSKMFILKNKKGEFKDICFSFNHLISLNGKIIPLMKNLEFDNDKEIMIKTELSKLNENLTYAFYILIKGENSIKRNRKKLVHHLEKANESYKNLIFSWNLLKF